MHYTNQLLQDKFKIDPRVLELTEAAEKETAPAVLVPLRCCGGCGQIRRFISGGGENHCAGPGDSGGKGGGAQQDILLSAAGDGPDRRHAGRGGDPADPESRKIIAIYTKMYN